jgi:hypothetical protein
MFGHLNSALLTSIALYELASASGATMNACFGFNNGGGGYDVNIQYSNVQSQSQSTICGNLQKTLTNEYSWCLQNQALNCASNGNLLYFGISTTDKDSGFSCVQAALIDTLQASVVAGPLGPDSLLCFDVDQGTSTKKRSRIESRASAMDAGTVAAVGQTITVASGQQLTLVALEPEAGTQNGFVGIVGEFFSSLIPSLATKLGSTGRSISTQMTENSATGNAVMGSINAGFNNGAVGNVNGNDYTTMLGALGQYLASVRGRQGVVAKFAAASGGAVALTVYLYAGTNL